MSLIHKLKSITSVLTRSLCAVVLSYGFMSSTFAGQACEENAVPKAEVLTQATQAAEKVVQTLEAKKVNVALIARVGQDLSKYNLKYSHAALVYKDSSSGSASASWQVLHELNTCATASSDIYIQGLGNFFLDDLLTFEYKIVVFSPEKQKKILEIIVNNKAWVKAAHNPHYNMLSYPYSTQYQNSNQFLLELLSPVWSTDPITSRAEAQAWLRTQQYAPTVIPLRATVRLGARITKANISFDDQPLGHRIAGEIATSTVESLFDFFLRMDPGAYVIEE